MYQLNPSESIISSKEETYQDLLDQIREARQRLQKTAAEFAEIRKLLFGVDSQ